MQGTLFSILLYREHCLEWIFIRVGLATLNSFLYANSLPKWTNVRSPYIYGPFRGGGYIQWRTYGEGTRCPCPPSPIDRTYLIYIIYLLNSIQSSVAQPELFQRGSILKILTIQLEEKKSGTHVLSIIIYGPRGGTRGLLPSLVAVLICIMDGQTTSIF